jgi:peptidoglycan/LPS O-acetylase OafA/YrhL
VLCGLDLLRFLLSVTILVVHMPHFSAPFVDLALLDRSTLPFASALSLLYREGGFAVEIFWLISGIIFSHFYLISIAARRMPLARFGFLRFSRLYPLHFVTLVLVAVLQRMYLARFHQTFVYQNNDALHFVLNLFMISFWNAKFGLSFNGPFWSVSVELFVYLVFFLLAYAGLLGRVRHLVAFVVVFFGAYALGILSPFYECLLYFFSGCLLWRIINRVQLVHVALLAPVIAAFALLRFGVPVFQHSAYLARIPSCIVRLLIAVAITTVFMKGFAGAGTQVQRILREVGNMTYSVYMIHISVQIALALALHERGQAFFNTPTFFLAYVSGTCLLGYVVYRIFELPTQNWLRRLVPAVRAAVPRYSRVRHTA